MVSAVGVQQRRWIFQSLEGLSACEVTTIAVGARPAVSSHHDIPAVWLVGHSIFGQGCSLAFDPRRSVFRVDFERRTIIFQCGVLVSFVCHRV